LPQVIATIYLFYQGSIQILSRGQKVICLGVIHDSKTIARIITYKSLKITHDVPYLIILGGWLEDEVCKDREVAFKLAIYPGLFRGSF